MPSGKAGMPDVVLDTSVVSLLLRDSVQASYYIKEIAGRRAVISFQTLEELWFGAAKNGWSRQRKTILQRYLERYEIEWVTPELVELSANLRAEREDAGRRLEHPDAWIAATALLLQCPLASHDGDFDEIPGLQLIRDQPP